MRKPLAILLILGVISCNYNNREADFEPKLCQNSMDLLSKFDTIPSIDFDLFNFNNDLRSRIENAFDSIEINKYFFFNSLILDDNADSIILSIAYYYSETDPTELVTIPRFPLLLNAKSEVYFGPDKVLIDSLNQSIYNLYSNLGQLGFPETYFDIVFTLLWDEDVDRTTFNKFILQIIYGYLFFVNSQSEKAFNKGICQLDKVELEYIGENFPFILSIAEFEVVDEIEEEFDEIDEFELH